MNFLFIFKYQTICTFNLKKKIFIEWIYDFLFHIMVEIDNKATVH